MGIEKSIGRGRNLFRAYPIFILLVFLSVVILLVAFPRKRPLREMIRPLTRFDAFFERYGFFLEKTLERMPGEGGPLYRTLCRDPRMGGLRIETLLNAAMDEEAYCAPLLQYFARESGAARADRAGMEWEHDADTAVTCLAEPRAIAYGGRCAQKIREGSAQNWRRFPPSLKAQVGELLGRSMPAASRFRKIRQSLGLDSKNPDVPSKSGDRGWTVPFEARLASLMKEAGSLQTRIDLSHAWLSLLYYGEGLDAFLREARNTSFHTELPPLPGDAWFPGGVLYAAEGPHGLIVIGGPGDNVYPAGDVFLLIDLGGDDTYFFDECFLPLERGGRPSPSSTVIDLEGDDLYFGESGVVAAGTLGFRTILDLAGRDRYRAGDLGLGAGFMGMGLLVDAEGDDQYSAGCFSLGAGAYGAGFLFDGGGDDVFSGGGLCQGFAGPQGLGVLVESSGNDLYYCVLENIPGLAGKNSRPGFAQGCSADLQEEGGGGIGFLLDLHGDDNYRCPSFGQGAARGRGLGLLVDARGYDFYNGRDFCQGSGTQSGIGILRDLSGSDSYLALDFAQGTGTADSMGFLIDDAGDDQYVALQGSQGKNQSTGIGMLHDRKGKDRFFSKGDE